MSAVTFAVIAISVLVAGFVQGSVGMGFAMIAAPVVSMIEPGLIPVMLLVLMMPLNLYVGWRERSALEWRGVKWISIGRFAGTFAGVAILLAVNVHQLSLLIGTATVLAAVVALVMPAFRPNRLGLGVVGVITGITETSTGVGGPPLALAYQHTSGPILRSTVAACFLVGEAISLVVLGISGAVEAGTLGLAAALLPFLALGSFASRFVHHRLDGPVLRYLVLAFATVSGTVVILHA